MPSIPNCTAESDPALCGEERPDLLEAGRYKANGNQVQSQPIGNIVTTSARNHGNMVKARWNAPHGHTDVAVHQSSADPTGRRCRPPDMAGRPVTLILI